MSIVGWLLIDLLILVLCAGLPIGLEIYFERKKEKREGIKRSKKDD